MTFLFILFSEWAINGMESGESDGDKHTNKHTFQRSRKTRLPFCAFKESVMHWLPSWLHPFLSASSSSSWLHPFPSASSSSSTQLLLRRLPSFIPFSLPFSPLSCSHFSALQAFNLLPFSISLLSSWPLPLLLTPPSFLPPPLLPSLHPRCDLLPALLLKLPAGSEEVRPASFILITPCEKGDGASDSVIDYTS